MPDDRKTRPPVSSYTPSEADEFVIDEADASTPKPFTPEKATERRTSKIQITTSMWPFYDTSRILDGCWVYLFRVDKVAGWITIYLVMGNWVQILFRAFRNELNFFKNETVLQNLCFNDTLF